MKSKGELGTFKKIQVQGTRRQEEEGLLNEFSQITLKMTRTAFSTVRPTTGNAILVAETSEIGENRGLVQLNIVKKWK